jgi:hypothetical protein
MDYLLKILKQMKNKLVLKFQLNNVEIQSKEGI